MIEQFNSLKNERKLELLYKAEAYIKAIWPGAEKQAKFIVEKAEKEQNVKKEFDNIGGGKVAARLFLIISAVLAVLWLMLPDGLLKFLAMFCLIPSVLIAVVSFCLVPGYRRTYEATAARIRELDVLIAASENELESVKKQNMDGFSIWYTLCPECKSPEDMRTFVRYFEGGRADTLKEAKNLLAQERYQGRMEQLSVEQIAAAEATRRAAERAESAARSASAQASVAATQARRAAYEAQRD